MVKKFLVTTFGRIIILTFDVTYDFSNSVQVITSTTTEYEAYQRVDILPIAGERAACTINLNLDYILNTVGVGSISTVSWGIDLDANTEPTLWNQIASVSGGTDTTGTENISIESDEYLYAQMKFTIVFDVTREADATLTLTDGTGAPFVCTDDNVINSLVASGSPLVWAESLIGL